MKKMTKNEKILQKGQYDKKLQKITKTDKEINNYKK